MADISTELARILSAIYGEDVRGSIHDAIEKINDVAEVVLTTGTDVTSPSSSSTGFYEKSLYLNTDTFELWKCTGVNTWASQGTLKGEAGDDGNGIVSIAKTATSGLVDTYTITYTDDNTDTFTVTNGKDGANGNKWYRGTGISGKAALPTVYAGSGVANANSGDMFLNPSEGAVYSCVTGGIPTVATWQYEMTLSGGGGGTSDYADLTNKPQINGHTLSGNQTSADLGLASNSDIPTVDQTYSATSSNAQSGKAVAQAIGALDKSDSAVSGQYVSAVSETDGIITVSRASLPSDTKNTAGTTNSTSKLFLAGATSQAANPQTYSNVNCYASGGYLYSNGQKVSTDDWTSTATVSSSGTVSFSGLNDSYGYKIYYELPSGDSAYTCSKVTKSGSGTSVTLTYTTDAPSGTVCKLRILK
jgi:hypothetical protein